MNIAYTIGVGAFRPMAELAAEQMRRHTGWRVEILGDEHYQGIAERDVCMTLDIESGVFGFTGDRGCYWLKYHGFDFFPDAERLLYFDADLLCVKDWIVPDVGFGVVQDWMTEQVKAECRNLKIHPLHYFNAGLMIIHRDLAAIFKDTLALGPTGFWVDQGAVNCAVANSGITETLLDRKFNRLINEAHYGEIENYPDTVNWHFFNCYDQVDARMKVMESLIK
jgi:hypothetical protein